MRKTIICLSVIAAILFGMVCWLFLKQAPASVLNKQQTKPETFASYFMQKEFYTGIENPDEDLVIPVEKKVYGSIVSHHFYVERNITKLFQTLSKQNYKTIVIIGPNHFSAGKGSVIVSENGYDTPWGVMEPDTEFILTLIKQGVAVSEKAPFEREHSISVPLGFAKYFFPDAKVVPIILRRNASSEKLDELAIELNKILPEDSLVLASVDFSHHVDHKTAQSQDKESIQIIEQFNYKSLLKLLPEQMDSPASIYALLKYLELKGAKNMEYWNTNAALVSGNLEHQDVTSYVFGYFVK